jgi:hypothetical protein
VGGTISSKEEADPKLILERAIPLDQVVEKIADRLILDLADPDVNDAFIRRLQELAQGNSGPLKTVLRLGLRDGNMIPIEVPSVRLRGDRETIAELERLVGEGAVRLGGSFGPLPGERRGGRRSGDPKAWSMAGSGEFLGTR